VVNSSDLIKLLMRHPKMQGLRDEAGTAFVQRETGAVAGLQRAVAAATAPTEGQRVLQGGYNGAIANGESREQTTSTIGENGQVCHQHLAQRSTVLPDGQGIQIQQSEAVVEVDNSQLVTLNMLMTAFNGSNSMVVSTNNNLAMTMSGCLLLEADERKKADAALAAKATALEARTNDLAGKLAATASGLAATASTFAATSCDQAGKMGVLEKRLASLEGRGTKRPKGSVSCTRASHPDMPWKPYLTFLNGKWGYKRAKGKQTKGVTPKYLEKQGFDTHTEACEALEAAYAEYTASVAGGGIAAYMVGGANVV